MTYEEYLDEVTTLIYERYDVSEAAAIKFVMRAQAAGFFSLHDEQAALRTQERAEQDAKAVFEQQQSKQQSASRPQPGRKRSGPGK